MLVNDPTHIIFWCLRFTIVQFLRASIRGKPVIYIRFHDQPIFIDKSIVKK